MILTSEITGDSSTRTNQLRLEKEKSNTQNVGRSSDIQSLIDAMQWGREGYGRTKTKWNSSHRRCIYPSPPLSLLFPTLCLSLLCCLCPSQHPHPCLSLFLPHARLPFISTVQEQALGEGWQQSGDVMPAVQRWQLNLFSEIPQISIYSPAEQCSFQTHPWWVTQRTLIVFYSVLVLIHLLLSWDL